MANLKISSAASSDLENAIEDISVDALNLDSPMSQPETEYINQNFSQYLGYYKTIGMLKRAIDMKAMWTAQNWTADARTTAILKHVSGNGKETFRNILKNMIVTMQINGDAFAEIIMDEGELANLKPLNPARMKIICNPKGEVIRYEQTDPSLAKAPRKFKPEEIFHLCNDRVGDEIHGVSVIEACESVILALNEAMVNNKKIMKNWAKPMLHFSLDTDNQSEIDAFVAKTDTITAKGENLYTPKDTIDKVEVIGVSQNSTIPMLSWIQYLEGLFFKAVGIPAILLGGASEFTESTAKIAYLAHEVPVADWQYNIEEQVWKQLGLKITLEFPASLKNELISDNQKDQGQAIQPSDTMAGVGR